MLRNRFVTLIVVWWHCVAVGATVAQTATEVEKSGSEVEKTTPVDPSGTWKWSYDFGDTPIDAKLKLQWDGKKLKGNYTTFDNTTPIENAKLQRDEVTFSTHREFNGNEFDVSFNGKVKEDELVGTVTVDFGEAREFEWQAKRAVEIDDVLGVWNLRLETPNGVIEPQLTLTKARTALHGQYVSPFGERQAKDVELKDNQLSWEISGEANGNEFKVVYKGKPRGNKIEGTSEFDFGGNTGELEFVGKRTPPEEKREQRPPDAKSAEGEVTADQTDADAADSTKTDSEPQE